MPNTLPNTPNTPQRRIVKASLKRTCRKKSVVIALGTIVEVTDIDNDIDIAMVDTQAGAGCCSWCNCDRCMRAFGPAPVVRTDVATLTNTAATTTTNAATTNATQLQSIITGQGGQQQSSSHWKTFKEKYNQKEHKCTFKIKPNAPYPGGGKVFDGDVPPGWLKLLTEM